MLSKQGKEIVKWLWDTTEESDLKRIAGQIPTEGISEINNLAYVDDGHPLHMLDIYYPEGTNKPLPVIIDIHGGGFLYGNKELNKYYCLYLASQGFTVVNISYRLCPEVTMFEQIKDCFAVYHWLDKNGEKYNCDMKNVFVTGDSAGGHLSALSCAIMGRDGLDEIFGVELPRLRFNAAGFTCGAFNPLKLFNLPIFIAKSYKELCLGKDCDKLPNVSYLNLSAVVAGTKFPPIYIMSSKEDMMLGQCKAFSRKLSEYKIDHRFRVWGLKKGRKLLHVFNVTNTEWEESKKANEEMLSLFKEYIAN